MVIGVSSSILETIVCAKLYTKEETILLETNHEQRDKSKRIIQRKLLEVG